MKPGASETEAGTMQQTVHAGEGKAEVRFVDPQNGLLLYVLLVGLAMTVFIWVFVQALSGALAEAHLRHKVEGLSGQVMQALRTHGWDGRQAVPDAAAEELRRLARYAGVVRMAVADGNGRVVWRTGEETVAERIAADSRRRVTLTLQSVTEGEITRRMARGVVRLDGIDENGERGGLLAIEMDATGIIAWYRHIGYLFAKVMTVLVLGAALVSGLALHRRVKERMTALATIEALRRRNDEEHRRVEALQMQLVRLQEELARLNRQLAGTMRKGLQSPAGSDGQKTASDSASDDARQRPSSAHG